MKYITTTAFMLLIMPLQAWAGTVFVPEPGVLPLLGMGVAAAIAVKFFRKKK